MEVAWNNVRDAYFDWCHMAPVLSGEWDNYAITILILERVAMTQVHSTSKECLIMLSI